MKYEVIGWTYDTDRRFPDHGPVTACIERAVQKDIRANGYCFGGDAHEDNCPVLNDGTLVTLSWRGWGGLMARARGEEGERAYMHYYMNQLIDPALRKYPDSDADPARIVSRLSLAEKFAMHLRDDMFDAMLQGKKRVEFRLFDEKRKGVDIGDYIEFCGSKGSILKRVSELYLDSSFEELFTRLTKKDWGMNFSAEDFGSPAGTTKTAFAKAMSEIYPPETQKEGVLAIVLEDSVPLFSVSFFAWTDERPEIVEQDLTFEEIDALPFPPDIEGIGERLLPLAPFERCAGGFRLFKESTEMNAEELLRPLFGKEDLLNSLKKELTLAFSLEVTALFPQGKTDMPALTKDVTDFLNKIGAYVLVNPVELK